MLDAHFIPQDNVRHEFCQMSQGNSETVHQFVIRLTHQADNCEFSNKKREVINKCGLNVLRRKLLEKVRTLKLNGVQAIARSMEAADIQA